MSNFSFLNTTDWEHIYQDAAEAEKLVRISPKAATILCRSAMELGVQWLYDNDYNLEYPYDRNLSSLIHEHAFKQLLPMGMFIELNAIRKLGNNAAHGVSTSAENALISLKYLFRFLSFIGIHYSEDELVAPIFSEEHLSSGAAARDTANELAALRELLEQKQKDQQAMRVQLEAQIAANALIKQQFELSKEENSRRRKTRQESPVSVIPVLVSEAQTRELLIDLLLKDAGWNSLIPERDIEYKVDGMPLTTNPSGKGYVDYVLWGDDGLPLAVIEAKKAMSEAAAGKQQAKLYADCLEREFNRRPIIFYTNGYEIFIWDEAFYPPRQIQGFYKKGELELMIQRRQQRKNLRTFTPNPSIADRGYQLQAIKAVAENFCKITDGVLRGTNRESLIVMATGSGKTRTAAAIVEMLTRSNWAMRVLFLADRNALVTQAKRAFNEHLNDYTSIDLTKEKETKETRFVFSTYPTIMNKIDQVKSGDERFYGVGHFDLIIIDEAHRSVYQKYRSILEYFDSLVIGLTATPRNEIDRDTYGLFGIENGNPSYAYELDTAVQQGYLVPPKSIAVPLKFQLEGVRYSELSDIEKLEFEQKFGDPTTGDVPEEIGGNNINEWLFNTDTVDKVLEHLMQNGLKVSGGEKLGKTIIFARNHTHAVFIEERFNINYPELGGDFLRVIDNYESKAQDLLDRFTDTSRNQMPQIAVSVDMMDTGVDAPNVLNLVFFKPIRSSTKFWQMIGRGTRLSRDLFGPGQDKTEFLIFDFCSNFEFFEQNPDGITSAIRKSLSVQIFEGRLKVVDLIKRNPDATEPDRALSKRYLDISHSSISNLDRNRYVVIPRLRMVDDFSDRERWNNLNEADLRSIVTQLAPLVPIESDDEMARRFDLVIIAAQIALLSGGNLNPYAIKVSSIAKALQAKQSIPQVATSIELIRLVQKEEYWTEVNARALEELRTALRELIKYLDKVNQEPVYTHFEDVLDLTQIREFNPLDQYVQLQPYKDRVEAYIRSNSHNIVIRKLQNNLPITSLELDSLEKMLFVEDIAGSKEEFIQYYGEKPLGIFVRSIVGLSREAVNEAFAEFLAIGHLSANQMRFVETIIDYIAHNGTVEKEALYDEDPFINIHDQGIDGVFSGDDAQIKHLFSVIDRINYTALAVA